MRIRKSEIGTTIGLHIGGMQMNQITQDSRRGRILVDEIPAPMLKGMGAIVQTRVSVVSVGTERAVTEFASQDLIGKALRRPDLVRQLMRKIRQDGIVSAYTASLERLDVPHALGYSSMGEVIEVGPSMTEFRIGDRAACAGGGYASHAEIVYIPRNLMVKVPQAVSDEDAAFAAIGAIALQGVRVADLKLGETVVVIGLGLLGLLAVQIIKAAGCMAVGTDIDPRRVEIAQKLGADAAVVTASDTLNQVVMDLTSGRGADAVLITAATRSNAPTELAGEISRRKGRVVAVGDVGMHIPRATYYPRELEYRISMSYGPGRYDPNYEEKGIDYPHAYVPFTERRNMETFLRLVSDGKVSPGRLVTHRYSILEAERAYEAVQSQDSDECLGVVFTYALGATANRKVEIPTKKRRIAQGTSVGIGVIGAGNYANSMLLPRLSKIQTLIWWVSLLPPASLRNT